jgi:hypothetical protein
MQRRTLELRTWIAEVVVNLRNAFFLAAGINVQVVEQMLWQRQGVL